MDTFNGNHFNLNVDLISRVLTPHIEASIRYKIKECRTSVHHVYGCSITKRKAFLGRKCAFEMVYGNWDESFAALTRYMVALKHFNPGTVVEWKLERSPGILEYIFRYVFWAFKLTINGFVHCRPLISIDDTHVYGKYDIKLLIVIAIDANRSIFPLAFAICANESQETWTLFFNHLKEHVVKQYSACITIAGIIQTPSMKLEDYAHVENGQSITCQLTYREVLSTYRFHDNELQPVGAEHYWLSEPFKMVCNKDYERQRQVHKRTRIRNQMDVGDIVYARKCGICSQTGHDRRKCPSADLGSRGNSIPCGSSSNVTHYQG
ncbi:uncharacterized protein [Nicotiana tomentosiformis]|uniref:uncharacterized protein n=1 Tax=Nicotiana tomentosiformis TaxID=4098 RepID=UPI00388C7AF8